MTKPTFIAISLLFVAAASADSVPSPEKRAVAFALAIKTRDAGAVRSFLPVPADCKFMTEAMKADGANPAQCEAGMRKLHAMVPAILLELAPQLATAQPNGRVTFSQVSEPGAPKWARRVEVHTQAGAIELAAFVFPGNITRFMFPMKKRQPQPTAR